MLSSHLFKIKTAFKMCLVSLHSDYIINPGIVGASVECSLWQQIISSNLWNDNDHTSQVVIQLMAAEKWEDITGANLINALWL